jgi:hypothetical protein
MAKAVDLDFELTLALKLLWALDLIYKIYFYLSFFFFLDTESVYVALDGLKFMILLPKPP